MNDMKLRNVLAALIMICLMAAPCAYAGTEIGAFLKENEERDATYPGVTEDDLEAYAQNPSAQKTIGGVLFRVTEVLFDGVQAHAVIEVCPEDSSLLLVSNYGWEETDMIPGTDITFAEKARSEGKSICYVFAAYDNAGASYTEKYLEDGRVLLYGAAILNEFPQDETELSFTLETLTQDGGIREDTLSFPIEANLERRGMSFAQISGDLPEDAELLWTQSMVGACALVRFRYDPELPAEVTDSWYAISADGGPDALDSSVMLADGPEGNPDGTNLVVRFTFHMKAQKEMPRSVVLTRHGEDGVSVIEFTR